MNTVQRRLLELGRRKQADPESCCVHVLEFSPEANYLLNDLANYPHAFVLGCLMDRQILARKAWEIPYKVSQFTDTFEIDGLLAHSESYYVDLFDHHNLHRMKLKMGSIFYRALRKINDEYGGDASAIWNGKPASATVVSRFLQFEGCGIKIATMSANILVRQYGIKLSDYTSIDVSPDVHVRRTMERLGLVPKGGATSLIIYAAREISPDYPGIIDYSLWDIGREVCRPKPECHRCELQDICPKKL